MGKRAVKKKISKKAMIARTLGAAFLAAGVVFSMMLVGRIRALDEFKAKAAKMAETRPAVVAYLDFDSEDAELSDDELKIWNDFEQAYRTLADNYAEVVDAEFARDEKEVLAQQWTKVEQLYKAEQLLRLATDGELSDDDLVKMKDADNVKMKAMALDLADYRAKIADFKEKYGKVDTSKNTEMQTAYDALLKQGDALAEAYGELTLVNILEMSRDDILAIYETIDLLKNKE